MKKPGAILPLPTRTHVVALAAGTATWLAGMAAVYLVAPLAVGRGPWGAHAAFEPGSNFGNIVAAGFFTLFSALVLLAIGRSRFGALASVLGAHGLIAIGIFYPAAVMDFAIAHVVALEDDASRDGGLAMGLVASGCLSMVLLGVLVLRGRVLRTLRARPAGPRDQDERPV